MSQGKKQAAQQLLFSIGSAERSQIAAQAKIRPVMDRIIILTNSDRTCWTEFPREHLKGDELGKGGLRRIR